MRPSRIGRPSLLLTLALTPAMALAANPTIDHSSVGCIVAGHNARLEAYIEPAAQIAQARVYFRADGTEPWYYVRMEALGASFAGILPKPKKGLRRIDYYVEATGRDMSTARTAEFKPIVVSSKGACSPDVVQAATLLSDVVVKPIPARSGAPKSPAGFSGVGGGGPAATTILAGAAILGGAGVAAVALKGDSNNGETANAAPTVGGISVSPALGLTGVTSMAFAAVGANDPDSDTLTYAWDFGDGASGSGPNATHVYAHGDVYPVRLQVSDPKGLTARAEGTATIRGFSGTWAGTRTEAGFRAAIGQGFETAAASSSSNASLVLVQSGTSVSGQYKESSDLSDGSGLLTSGEVSAPRNFSFVVNWEWCYYSRSGRYCSRYVDTWSGQLTANLNRCTGQITRQGKVIGNFDMQRTQ